MINSISIINFQSHRKTDLALDKGVNVIVGSSDSGKSSVIRSFLWVLNNRPTGDAIRNWKAKETDKVSVSIQFPNGVIRKERSKGKSKYGVNDVEFEVLKQDVPEEATTCANLTDCNIQTQHEPYFLLNETSGEVARRLNEIVGLDIIDTLFKNLDKHIRNESVLIKAYETDVVAYEQQLKDLGDVDDLYDRVVALIAQEDLYTQNCTNQEKLIELSQQLTNLHIDINAANVILESEPYLITILRLIDDTNNRIEKCITLSNHIDALVDVNKVIETERQWLECEPLHTNLVAQILSFVPLNENMRKLKIASGDCVSLILQMTNEETTIELRSAEYEKLLKKAQICPICFTPLSQPQLQTIMEKL